MIDCDRLQAWFDQELAGEERDRMDAHLADCARCQVELHELMQITAAVDARRSRRVPVASDEAVAEPASPVRGASVHSLANARQRRRLAIAIVPVAGALAAAAALLVVRQRHEPSPTEPRLALAIERQLEARVTWPAADRHRPYSPVRGAVASEPGALGAVRTAQQRGDAQALTAAWLLAGEPERARRALGDRAAGPDTDSDRAAIELALGHPFAALLAADAAIAARPAHVAARWNRALALRDLGLPAAAALDLGFVAASAEPGWREEAAARADALAGERDEARARAAHRPTPTAVLAAPASTELATTMPGPARLLFEQAVAAADGRAQLAKLEPIARALHDAFPTADLPALVSHAVDHPVKAGREASRTRETRIADVARDHVLAQLGASAPAHEVDALATDHDPWRALLGARLLVERGEGAAHPAIAAALSGCKNARTPLRCSELEVALAERRLALASSHTSDPGALEALEAVLSATRAARRDGAWLLVERSLLTVESAARRRHLVGLAAAAAIEQAALRP